MQGYSDAYIQHEIKRKGLHSYENTQRELNSIARDIDMHIAQINALIERADILFARINKPNALRDYAYKS